MSLEKTAREARSHGRLELTAEVQALRPSQMGDLAPFLRDPELAPSAVLVLERLASKPGYRSPVLDVMRAERERVQAGALDRLDRVINRLAAIKPVPDPTVKRLLAHIAAGRHRAGLPPLTPKETESVIRLAALRAQDPGRYLNVCWNCHGTVDESVHRHCSTCRWLACFCGACRSPQFPDRYTGEMGLCPNERHLGV